MLKINKKHIFHGLKHFSWETKDNKQRRRFRLLALKTKTKVSGSWEKTLIKVKFFYSVTFKINSNVPFKDVSGATGKSKMELFVTKVNGFQPLIFVTKTSSLHFTVVLDTPLPFFIAHYKHTKYDERLSQFSNTQWHKCRK